MSKLFRLDQVALHNKENDCWTIIHGNVYDLTSFLNEHPGGKSIILKYAGKDATRAFDPIHPKDIIAKLLPPSVLVGKLNPIDLKASGTIDTEKIYNQDIQRPPLNSILNLNDFEAVAKTCMRTEGWAYYSSAAEDEITYRENRLAFHRLFMIPRVMVNVRHVNTGCNILAYKSTLPIYITATALGKLGHPQGEVVLTKAAGSRGIIQMIPTLASCSLADITAARLNDSQVQFFQLYVNSNRSITERLVKEAEERGCKALFITVDAPTLAKREKDMRRKFEEKAPDVQSEKDIDRSQGAARAIGSFIDSSLCWEDLKWFRKISSVPIVLKGIQCADDAVIAAKHGVSGIVISNHGGRQLDFARSAIEILPEVVDALKKENLLGSMELYIDGGIRRGTDIFKAVALGAKAVGIGRPFLYAMSGYGQEGVEKAIDILRDELEMCMRLMGVTSLDQIRKESICVRNLSDHVTALPKDYLQREIYDRMIPPGKL